MGRKHFGALLCGGASMLAALAVTGCSGGFGPGESDGNGANVGSGSGESGDNGANLGTIWAVSTDAHSVKRVDTSTGLVDDIDAGVAVTDIAIGDGAVWATSSTKLVRIDPTNESVVATLDLGASLRAVATGFGAVWVADDGDGMSSQPPKLYRIDPNKNAVVATIAAAAPVDQQSAVLADAHGVFVQMDNGYGVARIDALTNGVAESLLLGKQGGYGYGRLALDGDSVWTLDQESNVLHRLDAAPLKAIAEYAVDARFQGSMAVGGGFIFFEDSDAKVVALSADDASTQYEISTPSNVRDLHFSGGVVVIATDDSYLRFYDASNGDLVLEIPGVYADRFATE